MRGVREREFERLGPGGRHLIRLLACHLRVGRSGGAGFEDGQVSEEREEHQRRALTLRRWSGRGKVHSSPLGTCCPRSSLAGMMAGRERV